MNVELEKTNPEFKITGTKYGSEGVVRVGRYADGMLALVIVDEITEETILKATVSIAPNKKGDISYINKRHVWIKTWSENEGIDKCLVNANVLKLTGKTTITGLANAELAELTEEFYAALPEVVRHYISIV